MEAIQRDRSLTSTAHTLASFYNGQFTYPNWKRDVDTFVRDVTDITSLRAGKEGVQRFKEALQFRQKLFVRDLDDVNVKLLLDCRENGNFYFCYPSWKKDLEYAEACLTEGRVCLFKPAIENMYIKQSFLEALNPQKKHAFLMAVHKPNRRSSISRAFSSSLGELCIIPLIFEFVGH